jgi:hypothetical protein
MNFLKFTVYSSNLYSYFKASTKVHSEVKNVSNVIILQYANTKSSVGQHGHQQL